jgi:hypothetical protein
MGVFRIEQAGVESGFVAEEQEAFRIGIETPERVNIFWESKLSQGAVGGAIWGELGENTERLMKGEKHAGRFGQSEDVSGTFLT